MEAFPKRSNLRLGIAVTRILLSRITDIVWGPGISCWVFYNGMDAVLLVEVVLVRSGRTVVSIMVALIEGHMEGALDRLLETLIWGCTLVGVMILLLKVILLLVGMRGVLLALDFLVG